MVRIWAQFIRTAGYLRVSILGVIRIPVKFRVEHKCLRPFYDSHVTSQLDILLMTASSYTTGLFSPDSFSPPAVVCLTTAAMTFDE